MGSMSARITARKPVRLPFRVAAGMLLVCTIAAVAGGVYVIARKSLPALPGNYLASLPGILWLMNLSYHAAIEGRSPVNRSWPFASDRVMSCYMIIFTLLNLI